MIAVRDRRDAWVGPSSRPEYGLRASLGWWSKSNSFNKSEMALFYECMLKCARKGLDTADIVREAIYQQVFRPDVGTTAHPCAQCRGGAATLGGRGVCSHAVEGGALVTIGLRFAGAVRFTALH